MQNRFDRHSAVYRLGDLAAAQDGRPIVDVFGAEVGAFSKYKLAKAFLRWARTHEASDLTADERSQWKALIDAINKALK